MIKMVVSDMDGTLLNRQGEISDRNLAAIHSLKDHEIEFVIASGRDYKGVYLLLDRYHLSCEAILGNGSQYVDKDGKILMSCYMDKNVVKDVVSTFQDREIPYMIFTTDGFYTGQEPSYVRNSFIDRNLSKFGKGKEDFEKGGKSEHMACNHLQKVNDFDMFLKGNLEIIKVEAFTDDKESLSRARAGLERIPGISCLSSFPDNVEVTDQNAQKGYILEKIIRLKGLSKEQVMVIGDGMNDLSLFECFPVSYAPANAHDRIRKLAGRIVGDCEESGFAQAVSEILEKT